MSSSLFLKQTWFEKTLHSFLHISPYEWSRVVFSFLTSFVIHSSYFLLFLLTLSFFIEDFTLSSFAFFYVWIAIGLGVWSLFSLVFPFKNTKRGLLVFSFVSTGILFFLPLVKDQVFLFYGLLFFLLSFLFSQLKLLLKTYTKESFSPLEQSRILPLIQLSEPAAVIVSGGVLFFLLSSFEFISFQLFSFLSWWMFLGTLLIFFASFFTFTVPVLHTEEEISLGGQNSLSKLKKGMRHISGTPYLKGVFFAVVLYFSLSLLIESQFIIAVSSYVSFQQKEFLSSFSLLSILFALASLLIHGARIQQLHEKLGIMKSMKLFPVVNIIAVFPALLSFGYVTGGVIKGVFEVSSLLYSRGYFELKKTIREYVKESIDFLALPLGNVLGVCLLFLGIWSVSFENLPVFLGSMIFICGSVLFFVFTKLEKQYTAFAKKMLSSKTSSLEKMEALEILSQKGHLYISDILGKYLKSVSDDTLILKIFETFGKQKEIDSISYILPFVHSEKPHIQLTAIQTLGKFDNLGKKLFQQSFAKHRVITELSKVFSETSSKQVKSAVIQVFKNINHTDIIPFLLSALENQDEEILADVIYVLSIFHDSNIAHYIEKYLFSSSPRIKSAAIMALWEFNRFKLPCLVQVNALLGMKDMSAKMAGIYTLGEIGAIQEIPRLLTLKETASPEMNQHIIIALAKMGDTDYLYEFVPFLCSKNKEERDFARKLIKNLPEYITKKLERLVLYEVSYAIQKFLRNIPSMVLSEVSQENLKTLKFYYELISHSKEILLIEDELKRRG
jgi:ATP/ADP translocase/HEAT repeat protein